MQLVMEEPASMILDPSGEAVPEGGLADGNTGLLDDNEENAGPKRGALDLAS